MTTNIKLLALAALAIFTVTSCDNDDDNIKVPNTLSQALTEKYPTASKIEWEKKSGYYVAECWVNNEELDVWFDGQGEWKMTETDLFRNNLPSAVLTSFENSEYANWHLDDLDKLEYPILPTSYVLEVEQGKTEIQLFYAEDGTLQQTKDVTGKSDEHLPQ